VSRASPLPVTNGVTFRAEIPPEGALSPFHPGRSQTLTFTAGLIRRHRAAIGSPWHKLNPGQQALLVLVRLRKGEPFAQVAAGFGVGTATAWRYVTETVALLAARAPRLRQAVRQRRKPATRSSSWTAP
jgi:Helix-turn-helix of DDE superfamily endonuclease